MLGMTEQQVVAELGEPKLRSRNFRKELVYDYEFFNVGFDGANLVNHVGFVPGANVYYDELPMFEVQTFSKLCKLDGRPKEVVGFIVLLSLGIAFSGFHDGDESQKAVSVFKKGAYEHLKPKMREFEH